MKATFVIPLVVLAVTLVSGHYLPSPYVERTYWGNQAFANGITYYSAPQAYYTAPAPVAYYTPSFPSLFGGHFFTNVHHNPLLINVPDTAPVAGVGAGEVEEPQTDNESSVVDVPADAVADDDSVTVDAKL